MFKDSFCLEYIVHFINILFPSTLCYCFIWGDCFAVFLVICIFVEFARAVAKIRLFISVFARVGFSRDPAIV